MATKRDLKAFVRLREEAHSIHHIQDGIVALQFDDLNNKLVRGEYYSCYSIRYPQLAKYCGPEFSCLSWPSANIQDYWEKVNAIINTSHEAPCSQKIAWAVNVKSPAGHCPETFWS
jgi:hypothetical protein